MGASLHVSSSVAQIFLRIFGQCPHGCDPEISRILDGRFLCHLCSDRQAVMKEIKCICGKGKKRDICVLELLGHETTIPVLQGQEPSTPANNFA